MILCRCLPVKLCYGLEDVNSFFHFFYGVRHQCLSPCLPYCLGSAGEVPPAVSADAADTAMASEGKGAEEAPPAVSTDTAEVSEVRIWAPPCVNTQSTST